MGKLILWTDEAKAQLRAVDQMSAKRILDALAEYRATGTGDVKLLIGVHPRQLRLRVGKYRLRFHYTSGLLEVLGVGHRRDVYR